MPRLLFYIFEYLSANVFLFLAFRDQALQSDVKVFHGERNVKRHAIRNVTPQRAFQIADVVREVVGDDFQDLNGNILGVFN